MNEVRGRLSPVPKGTSHRPSGNPLTRGARCHDNGHSAHGTGSRPLVAVVAFPDALAWLITGTLLLFAGPLDRLLGDKGIEAVHRLTGLLLTLL